MLVKSWAIHFLLGRSHHLAFVPHSYQIYSPTLRSGSFSTQLLLSKMPLAPDYEERAKANNFAAPELIIAALNNPGTVVLDVRTEEEIAEAKLETPDGVEWTKTGCTRTECPALEIDAAQFVKDKDATVVVYCASGARANRAKITLESQGYTNVLNGGGLNDILA